MTLAELIDIECQILRDSEADPYELRKRDRTIGQKLEYQKLDRRELFLAWLKNVQAHSYATPGQMFETGYRWLGRLLIVLGFLSGGGTAASVLSYDGTEPVNVVNFLAVIIGVQLVTILFFLFNILPQTIKRFIPGSGEFYNFIRELSYFFSRLIGKIIGHVPAKHLNKLWAELQRLKARQKLYASVEKWLVVSLTQRFGLVFNIGALATCLYFITFSDIAFAWNTTLEISNQTFHKAVHTIALPWSTIVPDAVPSPDLVKVTRYFRLGSEYVHGPAEGNLPTALVVGRWWLFLVLSLITYGLIPRIVIFISSKLKLKMMLAKLPLKSADFESLYDRLTRPLFETRSLDHEAVSPLAEMLVDFNFELQTKGDWCSIIQWGDLEIEEKKLAQLVVHRFGWKIKNIFSAGSLDYEGSTLATIKSISANKENDAILLIIESWEAPDAAVIYFLKQLRKRFAADRHIIIGLINTDSHEDLKPPLRTEWQVWKNKIAEISDPYLRVESLVEDA